MMTANAVLWDQYRLVGRARILGYTERRDHILEFQSTIVHLIILFVMYTFTTTSVPSTVSVYAINWIPLVKGHGDESIPRGKLRSPNYPKRGPTRPIISMNHSFELKHQRTEATHKSSHERSTHTSTRSR